MFWTLEIPFKTGFTVFLRDIRKMKVKSAIVSVRVFLTLHFMNGRTDFIYIWYWLFVEWIHLQFHFMNF
jgi:hypothetical protein